MCETISVIIPVRSELEDIEILKYLDRVEYPKDKIEIILSVGTWPSVQRNKAAKTAKGDMLYFFNKDARLEPDIFNKLMGIFNSDENIAVVGGPDLTPSSNSYLQHLFGYAMSSYFAHWKMRARYSKVGRERIADEKELVLSNMAVRREVFLKLGGFNERLYPNEENELLKRAQKSGYNIWYSPELAVYRDRRKNLIEFMRQFSKYGRGRASQIFEEGLRGNIVFILPSLFMIYLLTLPYLLFLSRYFISPIIVYSIAAFIDAAYISYRERKATLFLFLPFLYLIIHIFYAWGFSYGFFSRLSNSNKRFQAVQANAVAIK